MYTLNAQNYVHFLIIVYVKSIKLCTFFDNCVCWMYIFIYIQHTHFSNNVLNSIYLISIIFQIMYNILYIDLTYTIFK